MALALAASVTAPVVAQGPPVDGSLNHDAWKQAATVSLAWDLQGHRPAPEQTNALIVSDGKFVYVAFDAKQREAIVATQHTDDVGQGADDSVSVDFWPGGINGIFYQFTANPIGTHYQASSENSGYRPRWWSAGVVSSGSYVVTMKIPLSAMHGVDSNSWRVQFSRRIESSGDILVWSYSPDETDPTTTVYAGALQGVHAEQARPRPRIDLYGLGTARSVAAGGSNAQAGADFSIPYTQTSSFYGTIHPDYSNVELDQQSISPTAFRRFFSEVRPFFTQGRAAYNDFDCDLCPGILSLYTPSIPTPREGYAVEGKQGPFTYGAFNALGVDGRSDSAQAIHWNNASRTLGFSLQRVAVNLPGFHDDTVEVGTTYGDAKHWFGYTNAARDSGTNVTDPSLGHYFDTGVGYFTARTAVGAAYRSEDALYNPADGFVWHTDTKGWGVFFNQSFLFKDGAPIRSVTWQSAIAQYRDHLGELNDTNDGFAIDVLTRGLLDINFNGVGAAYVRPTPGGTFYPVTLNGLTLTFGSGADNSSVNNGAQHGTSATPTTFGFNTGRFGPGRLNTATFSKTVHAGRLGLLSLEVDENSQLLDGGGNNRQWLERLSYAYQVDRDESFAFGVRRIIGTGPEVDLPQPQLNAWNLSAAYHKVMGANGELYVVYGDASALYTAPQFIMKWIHYFGGGKGT